MQAQKAPCRFSLRRFSLRHLALAVLAAAALGATQPAAAQADLFVGVRAGYADLSGNGIFDNVYGGGVSPLGLQGEVRWPAFTLRLAGERVEADGNLFVPDVGGNTLPGSKVDLTIDLYHLTAAYNRDTAGTWSWFVGGGASFADADEEGILGRRNDSVTGFHGVGGVRWKFGGRWELGGELMYYSLTDLLEIENLTSDDLDGISGVVSLAFGF